jgi:hypothetical protein
VLGEFPDDVSGNPLRTPCKIPNTKNKYSFHGESLKSRVLSVVFIRTATKTKAVRTETRKKK